MAKIRALIVDDSSVMRKIVERSLRQAGLELEEVVEAGNGAEALAALGKGAVDLILCDINMPVMDGLEFVRAALHGRKCERCSSCHDYNRGQRNARGASLDGGGSRIYPQAVYSGTGAKSMYCP